MEVKSGRGQLEQRPELRKYARSQARVAPGTRVWWLEQQEGCSSGMGLDRKVKIEAEMGQELMIQKGKDQEHQGLEQ